MISRAADREHRHENALAALVIDDERRAARAAPPNGSRIRASSG
jgi:hypothetical protein